MSEKIEVPFENMASAGITDEDAEIISTNLMTLSLVQQQLDEITEQKDSIRKVLQEVMLKYPTCVIKSSDIGSLSIMTTERITYSEKLVKQALMNNLTDPDLIKKIQKESGSYSTSTSIKFSPPRKKGED